MFLMKTAWLRYGILLGLVLLFSGGFLMSLAPVLSGGGTMVMRPTMWTPVFTDTFDALSDQWTHIDNTNGRYHWGVTAYTRMSGTLMLEEYGFWSAGGGTLGSAQSWPTNTHASAMEVWAIAGPFTPTQRSWGARVHIDVQNRVAAGDTLFVGLSDDPYNVGFKGQQITESFEEWRAISWSTTEFGQNPVWIALRFKGNAQEVAAAGSLVDNLILEFNYGATIYLPVVRLDPTPTPLPTPTPIPLFVDDFTDPDSGWYTGLAWRYNEWCREEFGQEVCYERWEDVAHISYENNHYRIYVPMDWRGEGGERFTWFVWPAEKAPMDQSYFPLPDRYCIEMRARFANSEGENHPWAANWGIVMAGNADMTDILTFQINANRRWAVLRYPNYVYPGNLQDGDENKRIPIRDWEHEVVYAQILGGPSYNHLKFVARGSVGRFYSNDMYLGSVTLPEDRPRHNVGIIGGSYEFTPVEITVDYFRYDPFCPEAH